MAPTPNIPLAAPLEPIKTNLSRVGALYSDVTLISQDQRFPAHRLILDLHSPNVFGISFSGSSRDSQAHEILVEQTRPKIVQAIMDFFYKSTYEVPEPTSGQSGQWLCGRGRASGSDRANEAEVGAEVGGRDIVVLRRGLVGGTYYSGCAVMQW